MVVKAAKATPTDRRRRQKKDPDAPKRPMSAYMFYAQEKRKEIVAKDPNLRTDVAKVGKMIGAAWGKLDPQEKGPFEKKANADKQRYEREMSVFKGKKK